MSDILKVCPKCNADISSETDKCFYCIENEPISKLKSVSSVIEEEGGAIVLIGILAYILLYLALEWAPIYEKYKSEFGILKKYPIPIFIISALVFSYLIVGVVFLFIAIWNFKTTFNLAREIIVDVIKRLFKLLLRILVSLFFILIGL
jgi:hypothetical protein